MVANTVFFMIFSVTAVVSSLLMITRKHPLSAALSLVVAFISLAGLYALLSAKLLFIIQILVYAGAIMTLVIFSIMLLNVRDEDLPPERNISQKALISLVCVTPIVLIIARAIGLGFAQSADWPSVAQDYGTTNTMGLFLFKSYGFPFEVVSILLLISLLGVVVLAKRKI